MAGRYGLQIRGVTRADAPAIAELMGAAGQPVAAAALAARIETLRPDVGTALVAVEWGPPGGLVAVHWHRTLTSDLPIAWIDLLLVHPDDRRRGFGRLLLKAASQAARAAGCGELHLAAAPPGTSLGAFCLATGFERAGESYRRALRKGSAPAPA